MPNDADKPTHQPDAGRPARGRDSRLQESVDRRVPEAERLPDRADENPLSRQVRDNATGRREGPGPSTLEGGDKVPE